jgi:hypothetical protein
VKKVDDDSIYDPGFLCYTNNQPSSRGNVLVDAGSVFARAHERNFCAKSRVECQAELI